VVDTKLIGALIDLGRTQHDVHWGRFLVSAANLTVVAVMVAVFVLAIFLPYPRRAGRRPR
jgi:hypothetical protein